MRIPETLALRQVLSSYYYSWLAYLLARFDIAEHLADGPSTAEALAHRCGADPDALFRVLRAASVINLVKIEETGDVSKARRFSDSELTPLLRADHEKSMKAMALLGGEASFVQAWMQSAEAVRTGRTAFEIAHGARMWDYLEDRPPLSELFHQAQTTPTEWNRAIADKYDFSGVRRVVDVGGGDGGLARAIVEANPHVEGIICERATVVKAGLERFGDCDGRCQWVVADFFESVPAGGDVYLLRHVIHDWDDEQAVKILASCRAAMHDEAALILVENVMGPETEGATALFDLTMLMLTGGHERTEAEYEALLEAAGLRLEEARFTAVGTHLVIARPLIS
jgi:hypothetical protein